MTEVRFLPPAAKFIKKLKDKENGRAKQGGFGRNPDGWQITSGYDGICLE